MIVPAIIARSQGELEEMLDRVRGRARRVMLDVMDGEFVPGTSLDFDFELPLGFEYEAHLMVERPLEWLERNAGKIHITILHVETLDDIERALREAKGMGLRVALALNPETGLDAVVPYLGEVHGVLVMTVSPGRYGGRFLPETLRKVRRLREMDGAIPIEVDGGMSPENARRARDAGADIFASGSYILRSDDPGRAMEELREAVT